MKKVIVLNNNSISNKKGVASSKDPELGWLKNFI
jgi:hypothetical protein